MLNLTRLQSYFDIKWVKLVSTVIYTGLLDTIIYKIHSLKNKSATFLNISVSQVLP